MFRGTHNVPDKAKRDRRTARHTDGHTMDKGQSGPNVVLKVLHWSTKIGLAIKHNCLNKHKIFYTNVSRIYTNDYFGNRQLAMVNQLTYYQRMAIPLYISKFILKYTTMHPSKLFSNNFRSKTSPH